MKLFILRFFIPLLLLILWSTCANIKTPNGGPKDKRPPKLIASVPAPNQTKFKSVVVELTFDEAIKLNNPKEEIIISPSPGKDVEFSVKGNKVAIFPKTPWRDSTTYSILFREGIQDITESNVPINLKLAFSTGPWIDSLILSGNTFDLLEGSPKEKITVAIYSADTFDIFNDVPSYFTKTDKRGNFKLENIRAGRYRIYAFDDKNKNLKVESRAEMYGFLSNSIDLSENIDTLQIGLINLDTRPLKLSSIRNVGNITKLRFSKYLTTYEISSEKEIIHAFADAQTDITIYNPEGPDSTQVKLSATDSLENLIDTTFYIKKTAIKPVVEKFTWSLGAPMVNPENARLITKFKFNKPVRNITLDSLYIHVDSVTRIPLTATDLTYDSKNKEFSVSKELSKKFFGADQDPILTVMAKRGFVVTMDGDTSKALSSRIEISWPEENGTLSLLANTKEKGYIIQVLDKSSRKVVAHAVNTPRLIVKNIKPSEYQIRIIIDKNQNKKWDPGNILKGIEPEKVFYYRAADGAMSFPIRANWEVGPLQIQF